jgi:hypothetical protein
MMAERRKEFLAKIKEHRLHVSLPMIKETPILVVLMLASTSGMVILAKVLIVTMTKASLEQFYGKRARFTQEVKMEKSSSLTPNLSSLLVATISTKLWLEPSMFKVIIL